MPERFQTKIEELEHLLDEAVRPEVSEKMDRLWSATKRLSEKFCRKSEELIKRLQAEQNGSRRLEEARNGLEPDNYNRTDGDIMWASNGTAWHIVSYTIYTEPKCGHCGSYRKVIAKGLNGQEEKIPCSCSFKKTKGYLLVSEPCIYTGVGEYPLIVRSKSWLKSRTEQDFIPAERFDRTELKERSWGPQIWFSSIEKAEAYAGKAELGEKLDERPENDRIASREDV